MATPEELRTQVKALRNELKTTRRKIEGLRHIHQQDVARLTQMLSGYHDSGQMTGHDQQCVPASSIKENIQKEKKTSNLAESPPLKENTAIFPLTPIGFIESIFKYKNGTPRQANVCASSRATLTLRNGLYSNPEHALDGLGNFSHVWVMFVFHKNNNGYSKAKVKPPRLDGARVGLFSTRSPYRPNPVGLSLVRLEKIEGSTLHLSGVDMLDGTPVLDIKPYIPDYDAPGPLTVPTVLDSNTAQRETAVEAKAVSSSMKEDDNAQFTEKKDCAISVRTAEVPYTAEGSCSTMEALDLTSHEATLGNKNLNSENNVESINLTCDASSSLNRKIQLDGSKAHVDDVSPETDNVFCAKWVKEPPIRKLKVRFTESAESGLAALTESMSISESSYLQQLGGDPAAVRQAICSILTADPRSAYRRQQCMDRLYFFILDGLHITCWFDEYDNVEVVRIVTLEERKRMVALDK